MTVFKKSLDEWRSLILSVETQNFDDRIRDTTQLVSEAFTKNNKLLLAGNGGSAAEAQHMAGEYCATLSSSNFRKGYPALALTTDTSFVTAWANDFGFTNVFARQIETLGADGDVFFAYSTSGNSENILAAIEVAKSKNIKIVGFTGENGGLLKEKVDICFSVPSKSTARIQEMHTLLGHTICASVEIDLGH